MEVWKNDKASLYSMNTGSFQRTEDGERISNLLKSIGISLEKWEAGNRISENAGPSEVMEAFKNEYRKS